MPDLPPPPLPPAPAKRPRGDRNPDWVRERRLATVAFLSACGKGPSEIARVLGGKRVSLRTIGRDLAEMRNRDPDHRTQAELAAQIAGMVDWLTTPLSNALQSQDLEVQFHAVAVLWTIFKDKVAMEQAIGLAPREPEHVEVELGAKLQEVLLAVSRRMTPEAAAELARAVKAVHAEVPDVAELLVP